MATTGPLDDFSILHVGVGATFVGTECEAWTCHEPALSQHVLHIHDLEGDIHARKGTVDRCGVPGTHVLT